LKKQVVREFLRITIYNIEDYILRKLLVLTFTLACMLLCHAQCQASDVNSVKATIVKHAIEMGVDPAIALSIARTESGFRHEARSSHGAVGVFQLMPSTARRMGYNPYSLNENIKAGITYYKKMYNMFGSVELALAAYNAGPGNVKKYRSVPPYGETRRFVSKIMTDVTDLYLNLFRKIIPPFGGLDFSPIIAVIALQILNYAIIFILLMFK
jgi:hypothetical protein